MKIILPTTLKSDYAGFAFLASLSNQLNEVWFDSIEISFCNNIWFDANLCAVLGAIINKAQDAVNDVVLTDMKSSQKDILSRNNFLAYFGGVKIMDTNGTTIKYRKSKITEEKLIHEYLFNELLGKQEFPKLSPLLKKEIERSIFEIYSNAIIHGGSTNIYSCGQHFPNKTPAMVDFTIVNMGRTIRENVNEFLLDSLNGKQSIEWAVKPKNTTKAKTDNIPGGLGLTLIQEFTRMNKGKMQIISDNGYWQLSPGGIQMHTLEHTFNGTIVNMEFNLDDKSNYFLTSEKYNRINF